MKNKWSPRDFAIAMLLVGFFLLVLALVSFERGPVKPEASRTEGTAMRPIDLVNKHLREVYDQQEMGRKNVENLNTLTAPPLYKAQPTEPVFHFGEIPLTFDPDSVDELVGTDLRIYASNMARQNSLSEQIQQEIIGDIKKAVEDEVYKKALAEAIIQKARSQGYDIQVDDNFKIKSIRKIVIKEGSSIFDPKNIPNR